MRKNPWLILIGSLLIVFMCAACDVFPTDAVDTTQAAVLEPNITTPFAAYFIDVGQADAILILCENQAMLVDGGNVEDSDLIVAYLKKLGLTRLDYLVCTHVHEDHVGGLAAALNYARVKTVFAPVVEYDGDSFKNFKKFVKKQNQEIIVPQTGDTFSLGSAEVQVVGPVKQYEDINDTSLVLRIVYGETSFLLTGDAGTTAEHDMIEAGYDLSADVLKVGHHGSNDASSYTFLREVMPKYAVISVGEGNEYGHPHEGTLSRLRDVGAVVYRTDLQGDILCTSDGETLNFFVEKNARAVTNPTAEVEEEDYYIGNMNSLTFHRPTCSNLPAAQNRVILESREEALAAEYAPCGNCRP